MTKKDGYPNCLTASIKSACWVLHYPEPNVFASKLVAEEQPLACAEFMAPIKILNNHQSYW